MKRSRAMKPDQTMRTLYICYFGLCEPLVQTQVLPYLRRISADGIEVCLLTFEPDRRRAWPAEEAKAWRARLRAEGIRWYSLSYHKRPRLLATLFDIAAGACAALRIIRRHNVSVLHARAHVPLATALAVKSLTGCRLVFDIRGLMAEEYVDAGTLAEGSAVFRLIKWLERAGIRRADQVVVLTRRMREWLMDQGVGADKIEVIPCCVDLARFAGCGAEHAEPEPGRFEVVYAGSATGLYLIEEMARFFSALRARKPQAFLRVLTTTSRGKVIAALRQAGLNETDFRVESAPASHVPAYLRRARLGISFRKPTFSQIAASPTKIPEYLAAGLPVVCNASVGDMDDLVEEAGVGVVVRSFDPQAYAEAVEQVLAVIPDPELPGRCERVAREHFDLERVGARGYRQVYQRIRRQIFTGAETAADLSGS
jgi:glycosyltransferase involved in cell wall biosynthesis